MKIAIQSPEFLLQEPLKNFNGYNFEFFKKYCNYIYLKNPLEYFKYKKALENRGIEQKSVRFLFSSAEVNNSVDALVCFNGLPNIWTNRPEKKISIAKFWHTMDYSFKTAKSIKYLQKGAVDFLLGYTRHDVYCGFFKKYFNANYANRVISIPFGYSPRFKVINELDKRSYLISALGSVNPVIDPLVRKATLSEYISYFNNEIWAHPIRQRIRELKMPDLSYFKSKLPEFNLTKNQTYDPVEELNQCIFYINDLSIMNYPPARTYEGIACGSIMIAEDHSSLHDLGFIDDYNCILIKKPNLDNFIKNVIHRIEDYKFSLSKLKEIRDNSILLSNKYRHDIISDNFYKELLEKVMK